MNYMPKMDRRTFVVNAAAAGGGLAIGFHLPFGPDQRSSACRRVYFATAFPAGEILPAFS
jgi:hypothetical protein